MSDASPATSIALPDGAGRLAGTAPRRLPAWLGRLLRRRTSALAAALLLLIFAASLSAQVIAPYDPLEMHARDRFQGPSAKYWLGTDETGRDLFSRILYGAQVSVLVGLGAVVTSFVCGLAPGLVAGYRGGAVDTVIMRILDGFLAFPGLLLAMTVVAMLGPSMVNATLAIGVMGAPAVARLARATVLVEKNHDYVLAARALGASGPRVAVRTILPNCLPPLIVQASLGMASAILTEAALSFIGLGIQPPWSSLGSLLYTAYGFISRSAWYVTFPGVAIFLTVWSLNLLGDGVRDALDPRLRQL